MNPNNKRWNEFIERLSSREGCNFRGKHLNYKWDCSAKKDRPFATNILKKMGNIDIDKTMEFFDDNHGHCDCEIIFNVASKLLI